MVEEKIVITRHSSFSTYLWSVAAKKVAYMVAKFLVGLLGSVVVSKFLVDHGVVIDEEVLVASMTGTIMAGLEWAHDYGKVKLGIAWL